RSAGPGPTSPDPPKLAVHLTVSIYLALHIPPSLSSGKLRAHIESSLRNACTSKLACSPPHRGAWRCAGIHPVLSQIRARVMRLLLIGRRLRKTHALRISFLSTA